MRACACVEELTAALASTSIGDVEVDDVDISTSNEDDSGGGCGARSLGARCWRGAAAEGGGKAHGAELLPRMVAWRAARSCG